MNSLKSILSQHYLSEVKLGNEIVLPETSSLEPILCELRKRVRVHYWIAATMIAILFFSGLTIMIVYIDQPAQMAAIFSATGITISIAVNKMMQLGREVIYIDLVIALIGDLKPDSLPPIIQTILDKL